MVEPQLDAGTAGGWSDPIPEQAAISQPGPISIADIEVQHLTPEVLEQCAELHSRMWNTSGLPTTIEESRAILEQVRPEDVFVVRQRTNDQVFCVLLTLPIQANDVKKLLDQLPTQERVDELARQPEGPENPNVRICYSITGDPVKIDTGSEEGPISISRFTLTQNPALNDGLQKVAYSRLNYDQKRPSEVGATGPTQMHSHFGALWVGFALRAQPKDSPSHGIRTLVIYPQDAAQADDFNSIKTTRGERLAATEPVPNEDTETPHAVYRITELISPTNPEKPTSWAFNDSLELTFTTPEARA